MKRKLPIDCSFDERENDLRVCLPSGHYPAEGFEILYRMESNSFWFRSRNRLILWVLDHFFPDISNMLEIGCGTGFVLESISSHRPGLSLYGSELSTDGLDYACRRLAGKIPLFQLDACYLPFSEQFDVIGVFDVLEHIKEDQLALSKIYKAVVPGGGVILTVPQHRWMWNQIDEQSLHERRYTRKLLKSRLEQAGFSCIYATSFVSFLLPLMILSRFRKTDGLDQSMQRLIPTKLINVVFEYVLNLERRLIEIGVTLPICGSLLMVAVKK